MSTEDDRRSVERMDTAGHESPTSMSTRDAQLIDLFLEREEAQKENAPFPVLVLFRILEPTTKERVIASSYAHTFMFKHSLSFHELYLQLHEAAQNHLSSNATAKARASGTWTVTPKIEYVVPYIAGLNWAKPDPFSHLSTVRVNVMTKEALRANLKMPSRDPGRYALNVFVATTGIQCEELRDAGHGLNEMWKWEREREGLQRGPLGFNRRDEME